MYLRYLREGIALDHSIHVFAFVDGDLSRMGRLEQQQFGKPVLELAGDDLVTTNVPVPRFLWWVKRGVMRADFRSVDLAQRVSGKLFSQGNTSHIPIEEIGPVATRVFQTIEQLGEENNVVPVFVFLPTERDVWQDTEWRNWVLAVMRDLDSPFVDLTPALRNLSAPRLSTFFIPRELPAGGHYTEAGNEWVAEAIYEYMTTVSSISSLINTSKSH